MASLTVHIILSLISLLYLTVMSTDFPCRWSHGNASFDLCDWQKTSNSQGDGYWEVYDDRDSYNNNYTYQFNICGDVVNTNHLNNLCTNNTHRQRLGKSSGYCSDIVNGTDECQCIQKSVNGTCLQQAIQLINISTAAYQMPRKKTNKDCYRLHDGITPPQFSLIDDYDPTVGLSIKYIRGDWCPQFGKNREFIINFYCQDNYENVPDVDEQISEPSDEGLNGCTYILEIDSTIGCPTQCQVINDKLCAGNGICEYDETNKVAKCFCFDGWYGEACNLDYDSPTHIELKHNDGKYIVFLIVIVSFMTILALIITYLLAGIYKSKFGAYDVNTYIDEDMDVSINNNARIQRDKQLKSSHLAQPLAQTSNVRTDPPIVV